MEIIMDLEDSIEIFESASPGVVPFFMQENFEDETLELEVYSDAVDIAREFLSLFEGRYFSDKAMLFLSERIGKYLEDKGYSLERGSKGRYYNCFEIRDAEKVNTSLIKENTEQLTDIINSKITFDTGELLIRSLPAFITREDDSAVSIATVNEYEEGQIMLEVTVETSPEYRKRGYAESNTAALSKYLLERGYHLSYCSSRYNRASEKIAKKVGFERVGRFYAVAGYR